MRVEALQSMLHPGTALSDEVKAEVKAEINEATKAAEARPDPVADDAHERVYAEPIPGGGTPVALAPIEGGGH